MKGNGVPSRSVFVLFASFLLFLPTIRSLPAQAKKKKSDQDTIAARKYSIAHGCMRKRLYPEALGRWQAFIKLYPKHKKLANAYHHLGVCQLQLQKFAPAATTFRAILTKFPKSTSRDSAQLNLGTALYHLASTTKKPADFAVAAKEFGAFQSTYAKSKLAARALYYQAECFCLAGKPKTAIPVYQKIIASHGKDPLVPQVTYALAATQQDLQLDAAAVATLQRFLKTYGKHPLANDCKLRLGLSLFQLKKYKDAGPIFSQLAGLAKFPYADLARMKFGHTLFETAKFPEAAVQYELIPKQHPKSVYVGPALLAGGKSRFGAKQFPAALTNFAALATKKLPESPAGMFWQGKTLVELKKHPLALPVLDKVIAANAKHELYPDMHFVRGQALGGIPKRERDSLNAFIDFAKRFPKHVQAPEANYRAALAAHNLNDHKIARQFVEAFLANKAWAKHILLSEVLFLSGESYLRGKPQVAAKAEASFRRVAKEFPKSRHLESSQLGLATVLASQAKHKDVVAILSPVVKKWKDPTQRAEAGLIIGRSLLASKQPKPAIVALQQSQKDMPKWKYADEVLLVLGLAHRDAKDIKNSTTQLTALTTRFPKSQFLDHALYQLAEYSRVTQKFAPALALYQRVIASKPTGRFAPLAQLGIASSHYEQQKLPQSVSACSIVLSKYAKAPAKVLATAKFLRGMSQQQLGKFAAATTDLQQFLASKPTVEADILGAQFALSRCQIGLNQHAPAISSLLAILKRQPKYKQAAEIYYELGFAYLATKKPVDAATAFRNLATKFPKHMLTAESWYRVAAYSESQKKLVDSARELASANTAWKVLAAGFKGKPASPGQAQALELGEKIAFKTGVLQYQQKTYDTAIKTLTAQLSAFPKGKLLMSGKFFIAECQFQKKQFATAITLYQQVAASKAESVKVHLAAALYRGGLCGIQTKKWNVSETLFARLVSQHPKFPQMADTRYGLGLSQQNQKKIVDAMKSFRAAITSAPNSEVAAKSWFMMGQCSFSEKKYKAAIESFTEVAFGFDHPVWQPLSYFEAGRCYVQLKDVDSAKKMFAALIKDFPKHARVKDAQAILANLNK